jgi:bifunctional DNA-binding transcriptional regulator/antitoxin component of YhaV-PrlF toxin-antitoxin module
MLGAESPTFITTCSEDEDGNLILNFPDELLEAMGWKEGTVLDIQALPGRIVLCEVEPESDNQGSGTDD